MKRRPFVASVMLLAALAGVGAGLGAYTFAYARGYSYLTDDPAACANCHVMQDHYDSWLKSSHHAVATCNDCHTPEPLLAKYSVKAINGFNHSLAFTTGRFHEPLRANAMNRRVAQEACLKCHATLVHEIRWLEGGDDPNQPPALPRCERCHAAVGHP
jgi:cytochrome c nitrite reductase small subunit